MKNILFCFFLMYLSVFVFSIFFCLAAWGLRFYLFALSYMLNFRTVQNYKNISIVSKTIMPRFGHLGKGKIVYKGKLSDGKDCYALEKAVDKTLSNHLFLFKSKPVPGKSPIKYLSFSNCTSLTGWDTNYSVNKGFRSKINYCFNNSFIVGSNDFIVKVTQDDKILKYIHFVNGRFSRLSNSKRKELKLFTSLEAAVIQDKSVKSSHGKEIVIV